MAAEARFGRTLLAGLAGAAAAALWVALIAAPHVAGRAGILDAPESRLLDLRFASFGAIAPSQAVVIVAIDDATLARSGSGTENRRDRLAGIVDAIAATGPKAVAADILLTDAGARVPDRALAEALARVPTVIAAAGSFESVSGEPGLPRTGHELWPQPVFSAAARTGLVNLVTDASGTPRHIPLLFLTSRGLQPSLVLQAASLYTGAPARFEAQSLRLGDREIPLDLGLHMPLRLAGPEGTVPTLSASEIATSAERLEGKLVVLGYTASALGDRFPTPFDARVPGVEILAGAMSQLLGADPLRRDMQVRRWDAALTGGLAVLCTLLVLLLPLSIGMPMGLALLLAGLAAIWAGFAMGYWLNAALLLAGAGPPLLLAGVGRHAYERRAARRSARAVAALKRFQSPVLGDMIAEDPQFLRRPETRQLVVLFVDLTGFTRLSQALGPRGTEAFLKAFHRLVTEEIHARGGAVLNYMGDGALAVFGLTAHGGDPAGAALAAAFALVRDAPGLGRSQGIAEPPGVRVGLHAGPVILSRLGDERHQQVSVSGDTVNLASRLLEIAKAESAVIAASAQVTDALSGPEFPPPDRVARLPVRGRAGMVELSLWRG